MLRLAQGLQLLHARLLLLAEAVVDQVVNHFLMVIRQLQRLQVRICGHASVARTHVVHRLNDLLLPWRPLRFDDRSHDLVDWLDRGPGDVPPETMAQVVVLWRQLGQCGDGTLFIYVALSSEVHQVCAAPARRLLLFEYATVDYSGVSLEVHFRAEEDLPLLPGNLG